ncbi:MAG: HNH endonuclease [Nitrospirae bacterium]|nr:HNH endonuclease [Nitrospirota bacterium]
MATRLSKDELIDRVLRAVRVCGWNALILAQRHPAKLSIFLDERRQVVLVYIWNLTHGGFPRDPNELRIQVTGIDRFVEEKGAKTLVLGWSEDEQVFAAFDVTKHRRSMRGRSPSLQVRIEALKAAKKNGFAPHHRTGISEVAIAFRPDFISTYVEELEALHLSGKHPSELNTLERIAAADPVEKIVDIPAGPRKTVLQKVQRKVRDARFRTNVLAVYDHRCAVSGIQLDLLDAAHIIPVEHEKGTDELINGICLTPLHHRAFDRALIGIRNDYSIVLNKGKLQELEAIGWDGGVEVFKATLRDQINLPAKREHYPNLEYLLLGQSMRGWSKSDLA